MKRINLFLISAFIANFTFSNEKIIMKKLIKQPFFIGLPLLFASCATSMTPTQLIETLPTLSSSWSYSQAQADEAIKNNKCRYLVRDRNYTAPIGITVKNDLKNGARGIDEWVEIDGGNAYIITNYKWVNVSDDGATQLELEFDTMLCE